jgi:hypothetical protein
MPAVTGRSHPDVAIAGLVGRGCELSWAALVGLANLAAPVAGSGTSVSVKGA